MTTPAPTPTAWYIAMQKHEPIAVARTYWPHNMASEVYNPETGAWEESYIFTDLMESPMWQDATEAEALAWIEALPKAEARQPIQAAGQEPWRHLRGSNGWWIEMGCRATVLTPSGRKRRGKVTGLTELGPEIGYKDGGKMVYELVSVADAALRIAPDQKSTNALQAAVERTTQAELLDQAFVRWLLLEGEHGSTTARRWLRQRQDGTWYWLPERQSLHNKIVRHMLAIVRPSRGQKRFNMLGGGPAAGKSELRDAGYVDGLKTTVVVDCDEIKKFLPEYCVLIEQRDEAASSIAHGESSYIATLIYQAAMKAGLSVTVDSTGDGNVSEIRKRIATARKAGYEVYGYYATVPVEVALARSVERLNRTGRVVPAMILRSTHARVSSVLPQVYTDFDHVVLYDNSWVGEVVKVMEYDRNTGLRILAPDLWDQFVSKGIGVNE